MKRFSFTVWVDADSCPMAVRAHIMKCAAAHNFTASFVANQPVKNVVPSDAISMAVCEKGKDSADNYIFSRAQNSDIVVTRDLLFAERLVGAGIAVMNDRGIMFTADNIADRLRERSFSLNLAEIGLGGGKQNYYGEKEFQKFRRCFDAAVQNAIMVETYKIQR